MAIGMNDMFNFVVTLGLVVLVAGAAGLALTSFQDTVGCGAEGCALVNSSSVAYNVSQEGLQGLLNTSSQLPTIGTIIGVAVLIGIVIGAFAFMRR